MSLNEIETWIKEGRFYPEGLMICEKYGLDTSGLAFLGSPTDAQRARLDAILYPLRGISPKILATKEKRQPPTKPPTPKGESRSAQTSSPLGVGGLPSRRDPSTPPQEDPEAITTLRARARALHRTEAASHTEMRLSADPKRRYALAYEIMVTIRPALDDIYDQIREWQRTGLLPTNPNTEGDRSGEATMRRLLNLRSHVSKLKRDLQKGGWKDTVERRKRMLLEKKQAEINEIEKQLGNG
jgi:hypothetical protein